MKGAGSMAGDEQEQALLRAVERTYSAIAELPEEEHPIPVGRELALGVGYPSALLDALPTTAVEAFAGVGNIALAADMPPGATVLDLGCGAGLDSLIAAQRVGDAGRVVGIDFSEAMLRRAHAAVIAGRAEPVRLCRATSVRLPLRSASVDVALVNGIFNLNPERELIFQELGRVVRPGGSVYAAELILKAPWPEEEQRDETGLVCLNRRSQGRRSLSQRI